MVRPMRVEPPAGSGEVGRHQGVARAAPRAIPSGAPCPAGRCRRGGSCGRWRSGAPSASRRIEVLWMRRVAGDALGDAAEQDGDAVAARGLRHALHPGAVEGLRLRHRLALAAEEGEVLRQARRGRPRARRPARPATPRWRGCARRPRWTSSARRRRRGARLMPLVARAPSPSRPCAGARRGGPAAALAASRPSRTPGGTASGRARTPGTRRTGAGARCRSSGRGRSGGRWSASSARGG